MERAEAAAFLGVSTSTLDRLASQGKLTRGRARRKTRPVTIFDVDELTRLKDELATSARAVKAPLPAGRQSKDAIGFRLDPYYVQRLTDGGEELGLSAGEFARSLVIRGLEETSLHRFGDELEALRKSLSRMFFLILVEKFGATHDEANSVVAMLVN